MFDLEVRTPLEDSDTSASLGMNILLFHAEAWAAQTFEQIVAMRPASSIASSIDSAGPRYASSALILLCYLH